MLARLVHTGRSSMHIEATVSSADPQIGASAFATSCTTVFVIVGSNEAPQATLRFLAAPTDVNGGGKTHGGTGMRWIDEAAYACATGWCGTDCIAAYSGGIRFCRPIMMQLRDRLAPVHPS